MANYTIKVSLEELTIGDLEKLDSGSVSAMLEVFEHTVIVEGGELRDLHYTVLQDIAKALREQVEAEINPAVQGKN
jgi:hypothetical protein